MSVESWENTWDIFIKPFAGLRDLCGGGEGKNCKSQGNSIHQKPQRSCTRELTETVTAHTRLTQVQVTQTPALRRRSGHRVYH